MASTGHYFGARLIREFVIAYHSQIIYLEYEVLRLTRIICLELQLSCTYVYVTH